MSENALGMSDLEVIQRRQAAENAVFQQASYIADGQEFTPEQHAESDIAVLAYADLVGDAAYSAVEEMMAERPKASPISPFAIFGAMRETSHVAHSFTAERWEAYQELYYSRPVLLLGRLAGHFGVDLAENMTVKVYDHDNTLKWWQYVRDTRDRLRTPIETSHDLATISALAANHGTLDTMHKEVGVLADKLRAHPKAAAKVIEVIDLTSELIAA